MTVTSDELARVRGISHGFFGRAGGVSSGIYTSLNCGLGSHDDKNCVEENRSRVAARVGVGSKSLMSLYQEHGSDVVTFTEPLAPGVRLRADGAVTATRGIALGILTADCAPVLFADISGKVVGACHAGWRGALSGITDMTVAAMESLGANRRDIVAVIGPTIAQASYEVGAEFRSAFVETDASNARFFAEGRSEDKFQFNLPGYLTDRLQGLGLGQVENLDLDTAVPASPYFSYRRTTLTGGGDYGRQMSVIAIPKD